MTPPVGDLTGCLPRNLRLPLADLAIYALGRHRRLVYAMLENTYRAENDLLDRALCQRGDDIDFELVTRTPATAEERGIVIAALERISVEPDLAASAVVRMADDLRASAA